jgi:hypothetical protein
MSSRNSFSRWFLGVMFAAGLPVATAMAAEPPQTDLRTTAAPPEPRTTEPAFVAEQSAEAKAAQWQQKAEEYKAMGGAAYRLGLVQRAEGMVAKYATEAALMRARAATDPATLQAWDAEAARYERLATEYRNMGGAAYKAGLVQEAEAKARKYDLAPLPAGSAPARLYHETPPFKPWLN